jgi:hypothetical protein
MCNFREEGFFQGKKHDAKVLALFIVHFVSTTHRERSGLVDYI